VHTNVGLLIILDMALQVVIYQNALVVAAYYVLVSHLKLLDWQNHVETSQNDFGLII
jgi:hypothetical protein